MIIVSDTSPITNLALIGQLTILQQLYGIIVIPQAVAEEIAAAIPRLINSPDILHFDWIQIMQVTDEMLVTSLQLELDAGEAQAIALAIELKAELLLVDERRGRTIAARLNLSIIGLLGVLIEAKHRGLLATVKPLLDDLIAKAGFWISHELYDRVLQAAGE
jgi:predicted nucleic acid-binding protein